MFIPLFFGSYQTDQIYFLASFLIGVSLVIFGLGLLVRTWLVQPDPANQDLLNDMFWKRISGELAIAVGVCVTIAGIYTLLAIVLILIFSTIEHTIGYYLIVRKRRK